MLRLMVNPRDEINQGNDEEEPPELVAKLPEDQEYEQEF